MQKITKESTIKIRLDKDLAEAIKKKAKGNMSRFIREAAIEKLKED